jgi:hypothetical protein
MDGCNATDAHLAIQYRDENDAEYTRPLLSSQILGA